MAQSSGGGDFGGGAPAGGNFGGGTDEGAVIEIPQVTVYAGGPKGYGKGPASRAPIEPEANTGSKGKGSGDYVENEPVKQDAEQRTAAQQPSPVFQSGGTQWLRRFSLVFYNGDKPDDGLEIGNLRVDFTVKKMTSTTPNYFFGKVYNLSPETQKKVKQYARVQVSAGYRQAEFGLIFDGTVVLYIDGKENPTDTYLEMHAGDGDKPNAYSVTALTWPAGTKPSQQAKDSIKAMGVPVGSVELKGEQATLRSQTYVGPSRDHLRDIINAYKADFFVDDGKAYVIPWEGYRKGDIVNLSPSTGLVGVPKVTPSGVEAECLLNPKLRIAGLVKIDAKYISGIPFVPPGSLYSNPQMQGQDGSFFSPKPVQFAGTGRNLSFSAAGISPTGIYKILLMEHHGDTRGNPWYSQLVCIAADAEGKSILKLGGTAFERSVSEFTS